MRKKLSSLPKNKKVLYLVLILSVVLRTAAALYLGNTVEILPGTYDQVSYHNLALRILDGHGFTFGEPSWPLTATNAPTAHWSFLYTFFLVLIYALFGPHPLAARLIQAVLVGLLQPILVYLLARRIFNPLVGVIAAGFTAIYTYFIYYAATLMTEPFYITAILGMLYLSILLVDQVSDPNKSHKKILSLAILLGLTLGITVLLRQLFILFIPFLFLWMWLASRLRGGRGIVPAILISTLLVVLLVLPFSIYNYTRFGRFVLLNTNAGYAFFWANHPVYGTDFEPILPPEMGTYQSLIPTELRHLDEAALDQALLQRGLQFVVQDPIRYIRLSISRIPDYFMFWPSPNSGMISNISRVAGFGLFFPFMLYGLFVAFFTKDHRERMTTATFNTMGSKKSLAIIFSPAFLVILFVSFYTAIHLLSWTLIRYRLPVDAALLIFAALAVVDLAQRLKISHRVPR